MTVKANPMQTLEDYKALTVDQVQFLDREQLLNWLDWNNWCTDFEHFDHRQLLAVVSHQVGVRSLVTAGTWARIAKSKFRFN